MFQLVLSNVKILIFNLLNFTAMFVPDYNLDEPNHRFYGHKWEEPESEPVDEDDYLEVEEE